MRHLPLRGSLPERQIQGMFHDERVGRPERVVLITRPRMVLWAGDDTGPDAIELHVPKAAVPVLLGPDRMRAVSPFPEASGSRKSMVEVRHIRASGLLHRPREAVGGLRRDDQVEMRV